MCGITGWAHLNTYSTANHVDDAETIRRMCNRLIHRGPDSQGFYLEEDVALGIQRLAVIDIVGGDQPCFNQDHSAVAVQNGEIYNFRELKKQLSDLGHRFISGTDTEVLPHLYEVYGKRMVAKLNGMFAFAIWDKRKKRLFLARDEFGQKPLYYGIFGGKLIFGSELNAILSHPDVTRKLNYHALRQYLVYDYVPAPYSIFEGIFKLPAGHTLTLEDGRVTIESSWDLSYKKNKVVPSIDEAAEELRSLLADSTRLRMESDVPLGVMLSGGLDSASIAAFAQQHSAKPIKTFCVGFEESSYDESRKARRIAEYLGTEHFEERLSIDKIGGLFSEIGSWLGEPLADPSMLPMFWLSRFARKEVTVALGGDGADEVFAGYPSYFAHKLAEQYEKLPYFLRRHVIENAVGRLPSSKHNMSVEFLAKRFFRSLSDLDPVARHISFFGSFMNADVNALLTNEACDPNSQDIYAEARTWFDKGEFDTAVVSNNIIERMQFLDMNTYLAEDIMTKVDRASMAVSLEIRSPFLDRRIVQFAAQLPRNFKLKCDTPRFAFGRTGKFVLKKTMSGVLPDSTIWQKKTGFGIPVASWLRGKLNPLAHDLLDSHRLKKQGIFDSLVVQKHLKSVESGLAASAKAVWSLLVFQIWFDNFGP